MGAAGKREVLFAQPPATVHITEEATQGCLLQPPGFAPHNNGLSRDRSTGVVPGGGFEPFVGGLLAAQGEIVDHSGHLSFVPT